MSRRPRGRGRKPQHNKNPNPNKSLDSNGPDVRVRGSAKTIYDKYISLARDASASGQRVKAQNLLQHAEHYFRIVKEMQEAAEARAEQQAKEQAERQAIREAEKQADKKTNKDDGKNETPKSDSDNNLQEKSDDAINGKTKTKGRSYLSRRQTKTAKTKKENKDETASIEKPVEPTPKENAEPEALVSK